VTGDKKIRRSGEDDSQELARYLDMMDETDRRLTPEHIAAKLGDLLDHVPPEKTPEDDTPSSPGKGSTSGSLGVVIAGAAVAAGSYLARRLARKMMQRLVDPRNFDSTRRNFDPTPGRRGEHDHLQDERL
jgi:hypothetical protein